MKKRITASLLCAILLLSSCSGGGGGKDSSSSTGGSTDSSSAEETSIYTEVGTYPIVKPGEKLELKVFMSQTPNIIDFETNDFSKYLEEKTGITLNFETAPSDAIKEKINLKLSSGDYPDMFLGTGGIDEAKYGVDEGILIDVTDLVETQMPEFKGILAKHETMKGALTATDGKMYFFPDYNDCYHCTLANKMWVNTMQLEKMGEKEPTTIDEFYNLCKKFKEQNPNGVPLAGYLNGWFSDPMNFIANSFTYRGTDTYGFRMKGDTVENSFLDDNYRDALIFMQKMYKEGLLYEASYTMDVAQMKSLLVEEGEPVLFYPAGASVNMIDSATTPELYAHYYPIAPLKGPEGVQYASHIPTNPGLNTAITTACKTPEAAARLMDFNYILETKMYRDMGAKGVDWDDPSEGAQGLVGSPVMFKRLRKYSQEPQNVNWQDVPVSYTSAEIRAGEETDPNVDIFDVTGLEAMLYKASQELYEPYIPTDYAPLPLLKYLSEETTAMQTITVEIEKYLKDTNVQFMTGLLDANDDKVWENFKKGLTDMGLDKLTSTRQTAYERQYK